MDTKRQILGTRNEYIMFICGLIIGASSSWLFVKKQIRENSK